MSLLKNSKEKPNPVIGSKWVVVQLSPLGEREKNLALIHRSVKQILRCELEVFIPAVNQKVRDESLTTWYSEGYVFVRYREDISYQKLAETHFFSTVLSTIVHSNGQRKRSYSLLDDKDLKNMRHGMQELKIGGFSSDDSVKIIKGNYKNLNGKIAQVYEGGENVQVFVSLKSVRGGILIDFPASYLQKLEPV